MASDKTNEPTNTYNKFEIGHRFMLSITLWLRFLLVCWAKLWNYLIKMGLKMLKKFAIAVAVLGIVVALILTNHAPGRSVMGKNTDEHQANERKQWRVDVLALANKELAFQNEEKDKRAEELVLANEEKDKRAEELVYANEEKDKRAQELILANQEKDQRAKELIIANQELAFQNEKKKISGRKSWC